MKSSERNSEKTVALGDSLRVFGEQEAPQLGGMLRLVGESLTAIQHTRKEALANMKWNCVEPLKYYRVWLFKVILTLDSMQQAKV